MLEKFTYSLPIQARWNDMDPLGHVNNTVFFAYFELGRGRYMVDASKTFDWNEHMFLIGEISCKFMKELTMKHQNPTIWVRTKSFGTKSFVIEYAVSSQDNVGRKTVHAIGESTQIMFDTEIRKSMDIPDWLKSELSDFEVFIEEKV